MVREAVTPATPSTSPRAIVDALHANFDAWEPWIRYRNGETRRRPSGLSVDVWTAAAQVLACESLAAFGEVYVALWDLGIPLMDTGIENFGWRADGSLVPFDLGGSYPIRPRDGIVMFDGDPLPRPYPWARALRGVSTFSRTSGSKAVSASAARSIAIRSVSS
jgi:hypothetical protein